MRYLIATTESARRSVSLVWELLRSGSLEDAAREAEEAIARHPESAELLALLWEGLLPRLRAVYRVVDEVPLWSVYPTTTKVQLDAAGIGLPELGLAAETTPAYGAGSEEPPLVPGFLRLRGPGRECIDRLNLVDEKIHESSLPLSDVLCEIELHARRSLAVLLDEAPRGTLVFLFSDHGFRENPRWTHASKHRESRYRHGGASSASTSKR